MKRLFFLLALLLNLGPCFQNGKLTFTSGSLQAQSMGDESTCHLICSASITISAPCDMVTSIPCPGVTITSPPYEPPPMPEPPTFEPPTYNPCQTSLADACACFGYCASTGPTAPPGTPPPPPTGPKMPERIDCSGIPAEAISTATTATRNNEAWEIAISIIKANLHDPATQHLEYGTTLNVSAMAGTTPTYESYPPVTDSNTEHVTLPFVPCTASDPKYSAAMIHSHPEDTDPDTFNASAPSAGDVYALATDNGRCPKMVDMYTVATNGDEYVMHVTKPARLAAFAAANPPATSLDPNTHGFNEDSPIGRDFYKAFIALYAQGYSMHDAFGMATGYVLDMNNAGIKLLKKDSDGKFKSLTVTATTMDGTTTYTVTMCK